MTKAEKFVSHMIKRCQINGCLARLIGPMSEAYDLMVEAYAEMLGLDAEKFKKQYAKILRTVLMWEKPER